MKTIRTEILIHASPEKIWLTLQAFEQYPAWNPFIKKISGEKKLHGKLKALIKPHGGKEMEFTPTIQKFEPNVELSWKGQLWMPGLFDGQHSFKLVPVEQGKTLFIHSEQFSGLLVPLLWKSLHVPTLKGFELMNQALKKRVEHT